MGVEVDIPALSSDEFEFEATPGSYTFIYTIVHHEDMTGTLLVEAE